MTNRTFNFYGLGFGTETVNITVTGTNEGAEVPVYSGPVPTSNELPIPGTFYSPDNYQLLFTMQLPVNFAGSFPMAVTVNSGYYVFLAGVDANYSVMYNPVYTVEQRNTVMANARSPESIDIYIEVANPPLSAEEIAVFNDPATTQTQFSDLLEAHNLLVVISSGPDNYGSFYPGDCRTEVTIDGIPESLPDPRPPGTDGSWTQVVPNGSIINYTFNTNAGLE